MTSTSTPLPAGLARHKQLLLVALVGMVVAVGVLLLFWLGAGSASAQGTATTFNPSVSFSLPPVSDNVINDFVGVEYDISYTSTTGGGCSSDVSETYVIRSRVSFELRGREAILRSRPTNAATGVVCDYSVRVTDPHHDDPNLDAKHNEDGMWLYSDTISMDVNSHTFEMPLGTKGFAYIYSIIYADDVLEGELYDFAGTYMNIRINEQSGPIGCFSRDSTTAEFVDWEEPILVEIVGDRSEYLSAQNYAWFADIPIGGNDRCTYAILYEPMVFAYEPRNIEISENFLYMQPGYSATFDYANTLATASYSSTYTPLGESFVPPVSVSLPQLDANNDDINDFSGTRFKLRFDYPSAYESVLHGICPFGIKQTYIVDDNGSANVVGTPLRLIDYHYQYCGYLVSVVDMSGPGAGILEPHESISSLRVTSDTQSVPISLVTEFPPTGSISVPQFDDNNDGVKNLAETVFEVSYTRESGADDDCTESASESYEVGASGSVELSGDEAVLVDLPSGDASRCSYDVVWPEIDGLVLSPGATATIDGEPVEGPDAVGEVSATYLDGFYPAVTIKVSAVDVVPAGGDGVNDFAGEVFTVSYSPVSGSDSGCTASASANYVVASDGTVGPQMVDGVESKAGLVDRPAGTATSVACVYDVTWPSVAGLHRLTGASSTVRDSGKAISASYGNLFLPGVMVQVPQVNGIGNTNIFSGFEFVLSYTRTSTSDENCVVFGEDTFKVGTDGTVIRKPGAPTSSLVDRIVGVTDACAYNVSFPSRIESSTRSEKLVLQPATTEESHVVRFGRKALAAYYSVFSPNVTIHVPNIDLSGDGENDLSGTKIKVSYAVSSGSGANCTDSEVSEKYVVADDGSVEPPNGSDGDRAVLIDTPVGFTERCSYDVSFQVVVGNALGLQYTDASTVVSAAGSPPVARYQLLSYFQPDVTIKLASLNNGDGVHVLSGEEIIVEFSRQDEASEVCTDPESVNSSARYAIDDSGNLLLEGQSAQLVERQPGNHKKCKYDVTYDLTGAQDKLILQSNSTETVSFISREVLALYALIFSPDVQITVPLLNSGNSNLFADAEFSIEFKRTKKSDSLCTNPADLRTSVQYRIGSDGSATGYITRENQNAEIGSIHFISYPLVENQQTQVEGDYTNGTLCEYKIKNLTVDSGNLELQSDISGKISHESKAIEAKYNSVFSPDISILIPFESNLADSHRFFGVKFEVEFTVEDDSEVEDENTCGKSGSNAEIFFQKYKLNSDGETVANGTGIRLFGGLAGSAQACFYSVAFPSSVKSKVSNLNRLERDNVTLDSIAWNTGTEASYKAKFTPDVMVTIPQIDNDDGENQFSGVRFYVSFVSQQPAGNGCSPTTRLTYRAQDDGTVQLAEEVEKLVDKSQRTTEECIYSVSVIVSASNRLVYSGDDSITSGASPSISLSFVQVPTGS